MSTPRLWDEASKRLPATAFWPAIRSSGSRRPWWTAPITPVDSSDLAFEQAAAIAFDKGLKEAGPVLLEPVMRVQAVVPESSFGAIQADLLAKRGVIMDCRAHGTMRVIDAKVPLVELFGYSSDIRSLDGRTRQLHDGADGL